MSEAKQQEAGASRMRWLRSWRACPRTRALADRHYNRQRVGAAQFVPPGRCLVLLTPAADAFWVTSFPLAEYVQHAWAGAWMCSAFRNEGPSLSSALILDAVAATRHEFGEPPPMGMVTFVDRTKVRGGMVTFVDRTKVRGKRDFGYCYRKAGFVEAGYTVGGLLALQLPPALCPPARPPLEVQSELPWGAIA